MRIDSFVPTTTQKEIIRKIITASTPRLAALTISVGQNQIVARDALVKYGIIDYTIDSATLTSMGQKIADDLDIANQPEAQPITTGYLPSGQLLRELINM